MTAQTSFEKYRFGYGTRAHAETPHNHYRQDASAEYSGQEKINPNHVAVTLCFLNVDAAEDLPQPNADIVNQVVDEFKQKLRKARVNPTNPAAQSTLPKTELSFGNDLVTINGVSCTYVTFRLPLGDYDKVRRIVGVPALDESRLDSRPHTRHERGRNAPAP